MTECSESKTYVRYASIGRHHRNAEQKWAMSVQEEARSGRRGGGGKGEGNMWGFARMKPRDPDKLTFTGSKTEATVWAEWKTGSSGTSKVGPRVWAMPYLGG